MAAYLIVEIDITDPVRYAEYVKLVPPTIAAHGGKYRVRGGRVETLEGDWNPRRVVVVEFDSVERAKAWWACDEYAGPKALRQSSAVTRMIVVEGI